MQDDTPAVVRALRELRVAERKRQIARLGSLGWVEACKVERAAAARVWALTVPVSGRQIVRRS